MPFGNAVIAVGFAKTNKQQIGNLLSRTRKLQDWIILEMVMIT